MKIEDNKIKIKGKLYPDREWVDIICDYVCSEVKDNTEEEFGKVLEKFSMNAGPLVSGRSISFLKKAE